VQTPDWAGPLTEAYQQALAYLTSVPTRPVGSRATPTELRAALGGPLPEGAGDPRTVIAELAAAAQPGLVASSSGRFHGFVIGGATPAALAADWLTATWDQNAGLYLPAPAAAAVEEVAGGWVAQLLGLPPHVSVGFVTGGQMANFTGLIAGRHAVLERAGWDVERQGLHGAPRIRVVAGDFNDWRHRASAILERRLGMTEVSVAHHGRVLATYPSALPLLKLDRIYVRGFKVAASQVHRGKPWSLLSDHLAVSAELEHP